MSWFSFSRFLVIQQKQCLKFWNPIIHRQKHKIHWAKLRRKKYATDFALQHFDDFYGKVFKEWPSIRLALLCPHKYCAVINFFSNADKYAKFLEETGAEDLKQIYHQQCKQYLVKKHSLGKREIFDEQNQVNGSIDENFELNKEVESELNLPISESNEEAKHLLDNNFSVASQNIIQYEGYVPVSKLKYKEEVINEEEYYTFYKPETDTPSVVKEDFLHFPDNWKIYLYPRGDVTQFPSPKRDSLNLLGYYLMDGASVLPVLAMDVRDGDVVGDFCAAPGGKSLAILLTLKISKLLCNDISFSRYQHLKKVLSSYVPPLDKWKDKIHVSQLNVCAMTEKDAYDKVLLDVPCTNDRLSAIQRENNIFKPDRIKERIKVPQVQAEMLSSGLRTLKVGGSLVYVTCSLSPIQNDGVVQMTLTKLHEETNLKFIVKDLTEAFKPLHQIYCFSNTCKYGQLVLPFLPLNYGPMYFSKIDRIK